MMLSNERNRRMILDVHREPLDDGSRLGLGTAQLFRTPSIRGGSIMQVAGRMLLDDVGWPSFVLFSPSGSGVRLKWRFVWYSRSPWFTSQPSGFTGHIASPADVLLVEIS